MRWKHSPWARNFRPESERSALVVKVFDTWASQDPTAACRPSWNCAVAPVRDRAAVATVIGDVIRHDVHLAERLFEAIETPVQQSRSRAAAAYALQRR